MENASKALIIAGAILISILLISVGIIIMNAINDPVQQGASVAESQAVEIHNSRFTGYAGQDVDYNTAKQCIVACNSTKGTDHPVECGTTIGSLDRNSTYDIDFEFDDATGFITECTIEVHN
ncbi:MAG: hypothetical protein IJB90_01870 [Clostridia bacterium]|nr:hypothetical protein [Clostridia bacterium]